MILKVGMIICIGKRRIERHYNGQAGRLSLRAALLPAWERRPE